MSPWQLFDYFDESGRSPYQEWYALQEAAVQASIDATVLHLRVTHDWLNPPRKTFLPLRREHVGMYEIRFWPFADRQRKFRVAGLYRPEHREFIFLVGCEKRLGVYSPLGAFDLAKQHKEDFEAGKGSVRDHV